MPVPSKMSDLFTLAASNSPAGSDLIGNTLDDYIRSHAAIIRSTNALASASVAAASTTDLSTSDGEQVTVTGSATITSLGTLPSGIVRELSFTGICTLTNSAAIVLPFSQNIITAAGDIYTFRSIGSGNWVMTSGTKQGAYLPLSGGTLSGPLTIGGSAGPILNLSNGNAGGAIIKFTGDGGTTPAKFLRVSGGSLQLVNNANAAVIFSVDDSGNVATPAQLSGATLSLSGNGTLGGTLAVNGGTVTTALGGNTIFWQNNPFSISNSFGIGTAASIPFIVGMNNAETFRLLNGQMTLTGSSAGNGAQIFLIGNGATTPSKQIRARAGNLEIVNSANTAIISTLTDGGTWSATDFVATSDLRLKRAVKQLATGYRALKAMAPIEYDKYNKAGEFVKHEVGFGAQQVQDVAPSAVFEDEEGYLSVSHAQVLAVTARAVLDIVEALEAKGIL